MKQTQCTGEMFRVSCQIGEAFGPTQRFELGAKSIPAQRSKKHFDFIFFVPTKINNSVPELLCSTPK